MKEDFPVTTITATSVILVPLDHLEPAEDNLRGHVGDITELARSIAGIGVIEPLLVTPADAEPDRYMIVAGHRRHAAAARAGLADVPCIVREMSDAERIEVMLVENLQRSDGIPVLAEATGYFRLVGEHGYTIRRLAKQVGRSERHVRTRLALLELPARAQDALERNDLTVGQAEALLAAKDRPDVIEAVLGEPEWRLQDMERAVTDALRRAEHQDRRAALVAKLQHAGLQVLESEGHRPKSYARLSDLGLDETAHQGEACHGAVVEIGYGGPVVTAVCTDRRRHTAKAAATDRSELQAEPHQMDPERERAKERRRLAERRRDLVTTRLGGRLPRPAAATLLVAALVNRANSNDAGKAGALLGIAAKPGRFGDDWHGALAELAAGSEADRLRVGVAIATAMAEARIAASGGRDGNDAYLDFLQLLGYEPEPDELSLEAGAAGAENPTGN
jgi:ParB family chromosome partitioning protein